MRKTMPVALFAAVAVLPLVATSAFAGPLTAGPLVQVSPTGSPYAGADADGPPCNGVPGSAQTGRNYPGTEVEPSAATNPGNAANLVAGWQQDRWSDGGSNALLFARSTNGGTTWQPSRGPTFTRCSGGTASNGGDYERASDPWVDVSPNGTGYAMGLAFDLAQDLTNAMLVARSTDGGASYGPVTTLRRDTSPNVLNDKNSLTADPQDSRYAYAIWDRLEFPNEQAARQAGENALGYRGPTWFSRTTDGGATWETARQIFDPGEVNQTIGNQIVVTGDGTLVDGFDLINNFANSGKQRGLNVAVLRSEDKGATWDATPTIVDRLAEIGVTDPTTGAPVRTGDIIPEIAAGPGGVLYMVWQDARATGGARDQIALARSTDGGVTWRTVSLAINTVHTTQAFNPVVKVLPDGTVGVLYQDFRADTASNPLDTSTWLLHSHDQGATFTETPVGTPFDMNGAPVARGFFPGDYYGLGDVGRFVPVFVQATGNPGTPATNVYSVRVR